MFVEIIFNKSNLDKYLEEFSKIYKLLDSKPKKYKMIKLLKK